MAQTLSQSFLLELDTFLVLGAFGALHGSKLTLRLSCYCESWCSDGTGQLQDLGKGFKGTLTQNGSV